jgi:biotin operon repressor
MTEDDKFLSFDGCEVAYKDNRIGLVGDQAVLFGILYRAAEKGDDFVSGKSVAARFGNATRSTLVREINRKLARLALTIESQRRGYRLREIIFAEAA